MLVTILTVVLSVGHVSDDGDQGLAKPPQVQNVLAPLANNKFDAWTMRFRPIEFFRNRDQVEVAPMPRRVADKLQTGELRR